MGVPFSKNAEPPHHPGYGLQPIKIGPGGVGALIYFYRLRDQRHGLSGLIFRVRT